MQLKNLKLLRDKISAHQYFLERHIVFRLFYRDAETWYLLADAGPQAQDDADLAKDLGDSLKKGKFWKRTNKKDCYFPLTDFDAVLVGHFRTSPNWNTQHEVNCQVVVCLDNANSQFNSTHDALTGLANRETFNAFVLEKLREIEGNSAKVVDDSLRPSEIGLSIVALDIDSFKQINDTYGHNYGDIVIKSLARRLEDASEHFRKMRDPILSCCVARPSGEEFLVCLAGFLDQDDTIKLAERLRVAIAQETLPTNHELSREGLDDENAPFTIPPSHERLVTVSVGASVYEYSTDKDLKKVATSLKEQADTALYIAKKGGKNCVRVFDEILEKYGTVLEYHPETGVVAIDIGSYVNVRVGQEFRVIHPQFTGDVPFSLSDGRTTKQIGVYPRIEVCRIVAFDVQNEVSFCRISDPDTCKAVPNGSKLNAIPLGSITHLIQRGSFPGSDPELDLVDAREFQERIEHDIEFQGRMSVAVFKIVNEADILKQFGNAFIHQVLASLYHTIKEVLGSSTTMSLTASTELSVRIPDEQVDASEVQSTVLEIANTTCGKLHNKTSIAIGVYDETLVKEVVLSNDQSKLESIHALDYARYAALFALRTGERCEIFSPNTAVSLLKRLHSSAPKQAVLDYEQFRRLGLRYAPLEVRGALSLGRTPGAKTEAIIAILEQAVEIDDSYFQAYLQKIYFFWNAGAFGSVVQTVQQFQKRFPDTPFLSPWDALVADSYYQQRVKDDMNLPEKELLEMLNKAISGQKIAEYPKILAKLKLDASLLKNSVKN